jgi:hypothetical protein
MDKVKVSCSPAREIFIGVGEIQNIMELKFIAEFYFAKFTNITAIYNRNFLQKFLKLTIKGLTSAKQRFIFSITYEWAQ